MDGCPAPGPDSTIRSGSVSEASASASLLSPRAGYERPSDPLNTPYETRRRRAVQLLDERPHVEEIMGFYISLLELQEPIWREGLGGGPTRSLSDPETGARRRLEFESVSLETVEPRFRRFIEDLRPTATPAVSEAAMRLATAGTGTRIDVLRSFTRTKRVDPSAEGDGDVAALEFFARAFLQPVAERIVGTVDSGAVDSGALGDGAVGDGAVGGGNLQVGSPGDVERECPACGHPPQVGVFRMKHTPRGANTSCARCARPGGRSLAGAVQDAANPNRTG